MSNENEKKVDESWKKEAGSLKDEEKQKIEEDMKDFFKQASFSTFISSLAMQVMVFLGEITNPMTNEKQKDTDQAKYLIDVLNILRDKTKGNLSQEEETLFETLMYDLRVKFVEHSNKAE